MTEKLTPEQFGTAYALREQEQTVNRVLDRLLYGEANPVWAPIKPKPEPLWSSPMAMAETYLQASPDPIERALRVIWHYEAHPPRISQRYSLTVTEPKEGTDG